MKNARPAFSYYPPPHWPSIVPSLPQLLPIQNNETLSNRCSVFRPVGHTRETSGMMSSTVREAQKRSCDSPRSQRRKPRPKEETTLRARPLPLGFSQEILFSNVLPSWGSLRDWEAEPPPCLTPRGGRPGCFVNHSASPPSETRSSERRSTLAWLSITAARVHYRLSPGLRLWVRRPGEAGQVQLCDFTQTAFL